MSAIVSCTFISFVQIGAVVFAALAAAFWIRASMVRLPSGSELGPLSDAIRRQGRYNAIAGGCAAVAALMLCVLAYSPNCIKLTSIAIGGPLHL